VREHFGHCSKRERPSYIIADLKKKRFARIIGGKSSKTGHNKICDPGVRIKAEIIELNILPFPLQDLGRLSMDGMALAFSWYGYLALNQRVCSFGFYHFGLGFGLGLTARSNSMDRSK